MTECISSKASHQWGQRSLQRGRLCLRWPSSCSFVQKMCLWVETFPHSWFWSTIQNKQVASALLSPWLAYRFMKMSSSVWTSLIQQRKVQPVWTQELSLAGPCEYLQGIWDGCCHCRYWVIKQPGNQTILRPHISFDLAEWFWPPSCSNRFPPSLP